MNNDYEVVIGLEVHAELNTKSKIYCGCKNEFGREVNTNCCPICMGMPGTLPTLNQEVVEKAILMGHATHCTIHTVSKQDRKNYFYPDTPKNYQITQYDIPLCENGYIDILLEDGHMKRIGITRIHIEEDAGKLLHDDSFGGTLIDFNRCGVPLIEIVSEPDLRSGKEAQIFLQTLRAYLLTLGISDAKMQEGSIRCDVNVSVKKKGNKAFGNRCEMKNVNTFSGAVKAIEYEYQRQVQAIESGESIEQQTRRWDDHKGITTLMRTKENANDYRYFREPDLKEIVLDLAYVEDLKKQIPEMPNIKMARYLNNYHFTQAEAFALVERRELTQWFEEMIKIPGIDAKTLCNWLLGEISRLLNDHVDLENSHFTITRFAELLLTLQKGTISNASGKKVLEKLITTDRSVEEIIEELGLAQISDESFTQEIVKKIMESNQKSVDDYRSGKTNAFGYLMGQCMKETKGKGNPKLLKKVLLQELERQ